MIDFGSEIRPPTSPMIMAALMAASCQLGFDFPLTIFPVAQGLLPLSRLIQRRNTSNGKWSFIVNLLLSNLRRRLLNHSRLYRRCYH